MNVFVLTTGRTGSTTFYKACRHISNYSVSHESRCMIIGDDRLQFSDFHIEVDNRLSFFLGTLDKLYGDDAIYIHLLRNEELVVNSYNKRWYGRNSIMNTFAEAIHYFRVKNLSSKQKEDLTRSYVKTTNDNIDLFLKDKSKVLVISLENILNDYKEFWKFIKAEGDLNKALSTFSKRYNTTEEYLEKVRKEQKKKQKINFFERINKRLKSLSYSI